MQVAVKPRELHRRADGRESVEAPFELMATFEQRTCRPTRFVGQIILPLRDKLENARNVVPRAVAPAGGIAFACAHRIEGRVAGPL
jgi:hypothetical protein